MLIHLFMKDVKEDHADIPVGACSMCCTYPFVLACLYSGGCSPGDRSHSLI